MYHGFARSAGFNYWESAGYTFAGSALWEIAGETTPPSINDQVASGIGGTFLGEALFRMSNLILEHGGGMPRFWRELAAAAVSPSTGFNRLVFGDRFGAVFSSKDAAYYSRLGIGYSHSVREEVGVTSTKFQRNEAQVDFSIDYGLPGLKNYEYTRPFDYFNFQATASSANGFENVLTRGLLVGKSYEVGPDYRGVWGLYGSYDYISPQTFRVSSTALSLGTTGQLWLTNDLVARGHRHARRRLHRGRHGARHGVDRPRLQLRRHAAGAARAAPHPQRQGRARRHRARVLRQQASPRERAAATTTSSASTPR